MQNVGEELLRSIVANLPDALLLIDVEGKIRLASHQLERMSGFTRAELVNQPVEILIPERFRDRHLLDRKEFLFDMRSRPMGTGMELFLRRKDAVEIPVDISLSAIPVSGNVFIMADIRDIRARKAIEEELRDAEREKYESMARMAAYIVHQVNTPLTNIALSSAAIRRRTEEASVVEQTQRIDAQRRIATAILKDLMKFAQTSHLTLAEADMRDLVDDAVDQIREMFQGPVRLIHERPSRPVLCRVDAVKMKEVFVNLLKNAVEATQDAPEPAVTLHMEVNSALVFSVQDRGKGIPTSVAANLFQPFYTTKGEGGSGLGLAFAKAIVTAHGGTITFVSEPEKGSTFTVILPKP